MPFPPPPQHHASKRIIKEWKHELPPSASFGRRKTVAEVWTPLKEDEGEGRRKRVSDVGKRRTRRWKV